MSLFKAILCGSLLTWVIATVVGLQHSKGGVIRVFNAADSNPLIPNAIEHLYWSWPLFLMGTGLAWALFWMQE